MNGPDDPSAAPTPPQAANPLARGGDPPGISLPVTPVLHEEQTIPRSKNLNGRTPMSSTDDERFETIRQRAYEISQQPDSGSESENWARAERELTRGSSQQT